MIRLPFSLGSGARYFGTIGRQLVILAAVWASQFFLNLTKSFSFGTLSCNMKCAITVETFRIPFRFCWCSVCNHTRRVRDLVERCFSNTSFLLIDVQNQTVIKDLFYSVDIVCENKAANTTDIAVTTYKKIDCNIMSICNINTLILLISSN